MSEQHLDLQDFLDNNRYGNQQRVALEKQGLNPVHTEAFARLAQQFITRKKFTFQEIANQVGIGGKNLKQHLTAMQQMGLIIQTGDKYIATAYANSGQVVDRQTGQRVDQLPGNQRIIADRSEREGDNGPTDQVTGRPASSRPPNSVIRLRPEDR